MCGRIKRIKIYKSVKFETNRKLFGMVKILHSNKSFAGIASENCNNVNVNLIIRLFI